MLNFGFRRKWLDGRVGNTVYLMFALTFLNFILISNRFFLEGDPLLVKTFSSLWVFGLVFLIAYIPTSILIGYWHRKTQLKVEQNLKWLETPLFAQIFRSLIDVETGIASKEEIEKFRKILTDIEKK
jgi:hypothetical protein